MLTNSHPIATIRMEVVEIDSLVTAMTRIYKRKGHKTMRGDFERAPIRKGGRSMEEERQQEHEEMVSFGIWEFPSGNVIEVFVTPPDERGRRRVKARWRSAATDEDLAYYEDIMKHEIYARLKEFTESWKGISVIGPDDPAG